MKIRLIWILVLISISGCQNEIKNSTSLIQKIDATISQIDGQIAVCLQVIGEAEPRVSINANIVFHAASTMKTPVLIRLYEMQKAGTISFSDSILVKTTFKSIVDDSSYEMDVTEEAEPTLFKAIGQKLTIEALAQEMITVSSNLATNILIELADAEAVTLSMRKLGADHIQVLRGVEDIKAYELGLSNTTTANDLLAIFNALGTGTLVSKAANKGMLATLEQQVYKDIIGPGISDPKARVASKSGFITGVRHDSGLVTLPNGKSYSLIILGKNLKKPDLAMKNMIKISKVIWESLK